jgi:hypothetical protein
MEGLEKYPHQLILVLTNLAAVLAALRVNLLMEAS